MLHDFRGRRVLSVAAGLPAPMGSGTPTELVVDAQGVTNQPASKFDLVVCASAGPAHLSEATLASLNAALQPGGEAIVSEIVRLPSKSGDSSRVASLRDADGLRRAILFSGLVSPDGTPTPVQLSPEAAPAAVAALYPRLASAAMTGDSEAKDALTALTSMLAPQLATCTISCKRPSFQPGASFSLRSRAAVAQVKAPKPAASAASAAPTPPSVQPAAGLSAWSAVAGAPSAADDLIDEDALLSPEDLVAKEANMDCGTGADGKRKACKNCSCGLRELLEDGDADAPPPAAKSACGNCALGDAYRCAGCPHRGKPAFVDGSEVKLADAMEVGLAPPDAPRAVGQHSDASTSGRPTGVVMLSAADTMDDL